MAAGIHPVVSAETSAEGEKLSWEGRARAPHLPPPNQPWVHPPPMSRTLARPETRVQPSSVQEGLPEHAERTGSREAAGGGHSCSAEQQPIYFR